MAQKSRKRVRYLAGLAGCAPFAALGLPTVLAATPASARSGKAVSISPLNTNCTTSHSFTASVGNIKEHGWYGFHHAGSYPYQKVCVGTVKVQLQFNIKASETLCKNATLSLFHQASAMSPGSTYWKRTHLVCRMGPGVASTSFAAHQSHLIPDWAYATSPYNGGKTAYCHWGLNTISCNRR